MAKRLKSHKYILGRSSTFISGNVGDNSDISRKKHNLDDKAFPTGFWLRLSQVWPSLSDQQTETKKLLYYASTGNYLGTSKWLERGRFPFLSAMCKPLRLWPPEVENQPLDFESMVFEPKGNKTRIEKIWDSNLIFGHQWLTNSSSVSSASWTWWLSPQSLLFFLPDGKKTHIGRFEAVRLPGNWGWAKRSTSYLMLCHHRCMYVDQLRL